MNPVGFTFRGYVPPRPAQQAQPQPVQAQPVQFGWTTQKPPAYVLRLEPSDLKDRRWLTPTQDWINRAAEMLVGESDDTPRFFLIPNITDYTRDPELAERLQKTHPEFLQLNTEDKAFVKQNGWIVSEDELYGHKPFNWKNRGNHGGRGVYTPLHSDGQCAALVGLNYGPYKNVKGGTPTMADLRHRARESNLSMSRAWGALGSQEEHQMVRGAYTAQLDRRDFDPVNGIPIVIFNNIVQDADDPNRAGVLHGATRVTRQQGGKKISRPLFKTCLFRDNLAYWYRQKPEQCTRVKI